MNEIVADEEEFLAFMNEAGGDTVFETLKVLADVATKDKLVAEE